MLSVESSRAEGSVGALLMNASPCARNLPLGPGHDLRSTALRPGIRTPEAPCGPTVRTYQRRARTNGPHPPKDRSYRHPPMYAVISASASTCRSCATDARRIGFSSTGDSGAWRRAS